MPDEDNIVEKLLNMLNKKIKLKWPSVCVKLRSSLDYWKTEGEKK